MSSYTATIHFTSSDKTYPVLREGWGLPDQVGAKGRHATQSLSFQILSKEAFALFMTEPNRLVKAEIREDNDIIFEGVVRPYLSTSARGDIENGIKAEILDYTELLHVYNDEDICDVFDTSLLGCIDYIFNLAGVSITKDCPALFNSDIVDYLPIKRGEYLDDVLSNLLNERGYDYKFVPGQVKFFRTEVDSVPSESVEDIRNSLTISREDNWVEGIKVKYMRAKEDDIQIYRQDVEIPYGDAQGRFPSVTEAVAAGGGPGFFIVSGAHGLIYDGTYNRGRLGDAPPEGKGYVAWSPAYREPAGSEIRAISISRTSVECVFDKADVAHREAVDSITLHGGRVYASFHGSFTFNEVPIVSLFGVAKWSPSWRITVNAHVRYLVGDSEEYVQGTEGSRPDANTKTLLYIYDADRAQEYARRELKRQKVSGITYSFKSLSAYDAGSFYRLQDSVTGVNTVVRILNCNRDADGIYSVRAEGADTLSIPEPVLKALFYSDMLRMGQTDFHIEADKTTLTAEDSSTLNVAGNITIAGDDVEYRWKVNGVSSGTGSSITIGAPNLNVGSNTITCGAYCEGNLIQETGITLTLVTNGSSEVGGITVLAPVGYEIVTQYAHGEAGKGPTRWLADGDGSEDRAVTDSDSFVADLSWVDANPNGTCPLFPRPGLEIWRRQGIREEGSTDIPRSWTLSMLNVSQSFSFRSTSAVFERNTRSLDGDGYSIVGLVLDMDGHCGTLTLTTSSGVIGMVTDGTVTQMGQTIQINIPGLAKIHLGNYVVVLDDSINVQTVLVQAFVGDAFNPRAHATVTLQTKDEASWAYLGLFEEDEISSSGTNGPTDASGKIILGSYAGKQVVEGDIYVIKGLNDLNAEYLDIMTFIGGIWDYLSSHEADDPAYDEKLMVLAPEVYSGNVDSTLLPSNFSFIQNLVSKHVTAEFIGAKRIKLISTRTQLGAIYAGDVDWTKQNGKRVTSDKGFVLDGNGDAEIKNLDVSGNSFIHGDCTVGGTIVNKVQDTDESVFFTNKDSASTVAWSTQRDGSTEAVAKNDLISLLASMCSGNFRSASGKVNPRGVHPYSVYGVFMHPASGSAASYSESQGCSRNHNYTDTIPFLIPGHIPQSLFTVSWTAKWSDSANLVGAREVNRGSVTYTITNSRTGKSKSGTLMSSDSTGSWIGEGSLSKSGSATLVLAGGDTLSLTFGARGYAYSVFQNGNGSGSASISYATANYSAESDGGRDIAEAGAGNHMRGIIYFVVNKDNSASGERVALSFNHEVPDQYDSGLQDLLGKSFFELREMDPSTYSSGTYSAPFPFTSGLIVNNSTVNLSTLAKYYKIQTPSFSGSGSVSSALLAVKAQVYHNDYSTTVNYSSADIAVVTMTAAMVKIALNNSNTIEMTTSGYYQIGAGFFIDIETLSGLKGAFGQNMMPIYKNGSIVGNGLVGSSDEPWTAVNARALNQVSAREKKTNIESYMGSALEVLMKVGIVRFNYKAEIGKENCHTHYGFIAEDTPEELATPKHDVMDAGSCIGLLIKAVQEMYAELQELRRKT